MYPSKYLSYNIFKISFWAQKDPLSPKLSTSSWLQVLNLILFRYWIQFQGKKIICLYISLTDIHSQTWWPCLIYKHIYFYIFIYMYVCSIYDVIESGDRNLPNIHGMGIQFQELSCRITFFFIPLRTLECNMIWSLFWKGSHVIDGFLLSFMQLFYCNKKMIDE